jgi:hypothetical protein
MGRLPDFIVCGLWKCGTTTLKDCLKQHPNIYIPDDELQYYSNHKYHNLNIDWYKSQFNGYEQKICGEKSAGYAHKLEVMKRLSQDKEYKLILMLRNPVNRLYSHYWMDKRYGRIKENFDDYSKLDTLNKRVGNYSNSINNILRYVNEENLKVIILEEFKHNQQHIMNDTFKYLGASKYKIDYTHSLRGCAVSDSVAKKRGQLRANLVKLQNNGFTKNDKVVQQLLKKDRELLKQRFKYPKIEKQVRNRLLEYYNDDIKKTSNILNKNLKKWWH